MTAPQDNPMMGKILAALKSDGQWFEAVKPVPQPLKDGIANHGEASDEQKKLIEEFGYRSWYDFCVGEWGTKWDATIGSFEQDGDSVTVYFDTAWSPPEGIYKAMEDAGIKVEATYCEQGIGYMGYRKDGEDYCCDMPEYDGEDSPEYHQAIDKVWDDAGITHAPHHLGG